MATDILLFCTGIVIGGMNAIAGGGGLVGFPVLLSVGLPALTADATSFIAVLPGQISSAIGYRRFLRRVPKVYALLLIPAAIGAAMGAQLLKHTSFAGFEKIVPFLILLSVIIFALQPLMHFHLMRHLRSRHKSAVKLILLGAAVLVMTVYGGYFGVGLGFAILALLGFTSLHEIHMLNGMKNVMAIVVVSVAILSIYSAHIISWKHGLVMGAGNLLGGYAGSRLAQKVPSHLIRLVVIAIGLVTASYLALRYH
jgi:uncharacterized membrane protein YfcA